MPTNRQGYYEAYYEIYGNRIKNNANLKLYCPACKKEVSNSHFARHKKTMGHNINVTKMMMKNLEDEIIAME